MSNTGKLLRSHGIESNLVKLILEKVAPLLEANENDDPPQSLFQDVMGSSLVWEG